MAAFKVISAESHIVEPPGMYTSRVEPNSASERRRSSAARRQMGNYDAWVLDGVQAGTQGAVMTCANCGITYAAHFEHAERYPAWMTDEVDRRVKDPPMVPQRGEVRNGSACDVPVDGDGVAAAGSIRKLMFSQAVTTDKGILIVLCSRGPLPCQNSQMPPPRPPAASLGTKAN